jgi:hypothetical protein
MGYGSNEFNVQSPAVDDVGGESAEVRDRANHRRDVALQVAFERQTLKPAFSLDRL